jgi:hypothetical protein
MAESDPSTDFLRQHRPTIKSDDIHGIGAPGVVCYRGMAWLLQTMLYYAEHVGLTGLFRTIVQPPVVAHPSPDAYTAVSKSPVDSESKVHKD